MSVLISPPTVVNMLLRLYTFYADGDSRSKITDAEYAQLNGHMNGHAMNGHAQGSHDPSSAVRDAEEFELDGLMTDDEDEVVHKQNGRA